MPLVRCHLVVEGSLSAVMCACRGSCVLILTGGIGGRCEIDQGRQPYNADDGDATNKDSQNHIDMKYDPQIQEGRNAHKIPTLNISTSWILFFLPMLSFHSCGIGSRMMMRSSTMLMLDWAHANVLKLKQ